MSKKTDDRLFDAELKIAELEKRLAKCERLIQTIKSRPAKKGYPGSAYDLTRAPKRKPIPVNRKRK